jgi:phosphotransferase system enzyme I (PtsP)
MAPASIGPVKTMILSLDAARATKLLDELVRKGARNIREQIVAFAKAEGIEI